jgi:hypothetical protein
MAKTKGSKDLTPRKRACETGSKKKRKAAYQIEVANRQHGGGMDRFTVPAAAGNNNEQEMDYSEAELDLPTEYEPAAPADELLSASDEESSTAEDEDGVEDLQDDDDAEFEQYETGGAMKEFLEQVYKQLRLEITGNKCTTKWLVKHLEDNDWWIRLCHAKTISRQLGISYDEYNLGYYHDICVWLPDVRWNYMPSCPCCLESGEVHFHGWRDNHFGRIVIRNNGHYFVVSRRYRCNHCKIEYKKTHTTEQETHYTFMGYNMTSIPLLPHGKGDKFPAFLTHRSGVSKKLISWIRPLMCKGTRIKHIRDAIAECSTKEYTELYKAREDQISEDRQLQPDKEVTTLPNMEA